MQTLLNIFSEGAAEITIGLFLVLGGLSFFFFYQAIKASKSGSTQQTPYGQKTDGNIPIWKLPKFWMGVAVIIFLVICLLIVNADYRPYNPKKDGEIKPPVEDGRIPAQDLISK